MALFTVASVRSMGFSQKMCFLWAAASSICDACSPVGEQMMTASTSGSAITSEALSVQRGMPNAAAASWATPPIGSEI